MHLLKQLHHAEGKGEIIKHDEPGFDYVTLQYCTVHKQGLCLLAVGL